jgi:hypothetical protein
VSTRDGICTSPHGAVVTSGDRDSRLHRVMSAVTGGDRPNGRQVWVQVTWLPNETGNGPLTSGS